MGDHALDAQRKALHTPSTKYTHPLSGGVRAQAPPATGGDAGQMKSSP